MALAHVNRTMNIGTLDFPFGEGNGCVSHKNQLIILCFGESGHKQCRTSTDPVGPFERVHDSHFDHHLTEISTSSDGESFKQHI